MRAGRRHSIADATLAVRFERNFKHEEEVNMFDRQPRWSVHTASSCPTTEDPHDFWYGNRDWRPLENGNVGQPCPASNSLLEVYQFRKKNFSGHVRLQWHPSQNYHTQECELEDEKTTSGKTWSVADYFAGQFHRG